MIIRDRDNRALEDAQEIAERVSKKLESGSPQHRMWNARDELPIARALQTFLRITELQAEAIVEMDELIASRALESMLTYDSDGKPA